MLKPFFFKQPITDVWFIFSFLCLQIFILYFKVQINRCVFGLFDKIQDDCYNHETLLSLFDTYVKCILNYGCEVWGYHTAPDIEKIHLYFLKRILKVRKSAEFLTYLSYTSHTHLNIGLQHQSFFVIRVYFH
jgi:hypothetical protein